jgi:cation diffusion facilitator CzcD-associated flavoprotein CzcO
MIELGTPRAEEVTVIVIGAGITGIGAAYYLRESRLSYVILEQGDDLGGVWSTHRWHGARCDSDAIKYSFSFKPLLSTQCVVDQAEIHRYLHAVVDEFGIRPHIRFKTRVTKAVFDLSAERWVVYTGSGTFTSRFLLNGNGYFSDPHILTFKGTASFKGEIVHSAHRDGRRRFGDRDVVVVGSGATAICCAPELAPPVSRTLVLVQRSPSYIYEISNKIDRLTALCQYLYTRGFTSAVRLLRYYLQCRDDVIFVGFRRYPRIARWFFRRHWVGAVGPARYREHFRPRYNPWEQRITVAIGLKEKLRTGAMAMTTGEIDRFTEGSIVLRGGEEIRCDVCVLATGFDLELLKFEMWVGDERIDVAGINFYKGIMLGGVPNYFHPFGAWHTAWTQRSETATRFAIRIIKYMAKRRLSTVRVDRRDVTFTPSLTPGYITRCLARLPRFYGTYDLPSVDNILSFRFHPRQFTFAGAGGAGSALKSAAASERSQFARAGDATIRSS